MSRVTNWKAVWSWMLYDWAAQPYHTLLVTFIFAPYFTSAVVGDPVKGQVIWGYTVATAGILVAVVAPILGAVADAVGPRRPWIFLFSAFHVAGAFALWWAVPGMDGVTLVLVAFAIGLIGVEFTQIYTNAMLPDLVPQRQVGLISGWGWATGYGGGLLSLLIMLLLLAENAAGVTLLGNPPAFGLDASAREGTRSVGPLSAAWYVLFMIPFILFVPDKSRRPQSGDAIRRGLASLVRTIRTLPKRVSYSCFLAASMFYRDALVGIFSFGGIYAAGVLGWSIIQIGTFGILGTLSGFAFCYVGGFADRRYGPKPVIVTCIVTLALVCTLIVGTSRTAIFGVALAPQSSLPDVLFMVCGAIIGAAGGVLQAASRTLLVHQTDTGNMAESFGLYALAGKATAFIAPFSIAVFTEMTGSQRLGVIPVVVLFLIGLVLLLPVKSHDTNE
ncbi:MAG: MFS transporter [Paracoccaceae bacterium]|nr:MFS transporter [Paracoccaceae bacterium]